MTAKSRRVVCILSSLASVAPLNLFVGAYPRAAAVSNGKGVDNASRNLPKSNDIDERIEEGPIWFWREDWNSELQ